MKLSIIEIICAVISTIITIVVITAIQKNQDRINSNLKKIKVLQTIDILKD
jgi:hypothetical protein